MVTFQCIRTFLVISFMSIRVMSDVASLGTWANCVDTVRSK